MKLFFILLIVIGAIMIFLEWFGSSNSDSVPMEFAFLGNKGVAAVAIGILGLICLWLLP